MKSLGQLTSMIMFSVTCAASAAGGGKARAKRGAQIQERQQHWQGTLRASVACWLELFSAASRFESDADAAQRGKKKEEDDFNWKDEDEPSVDTKPLPGARAPAYRSFHCLFARHTRSKLTSVRRAGGFKSMKSRWLSEFEREQKEREAAAAAAGSGGGGQGAPRAGPPSAQLASQAADVHIPGTGNGVAGGSGAGSGAAGAPAGVPAGLESAAVKAEPSISAPRPLGAAAAEAAEASVPTSAAVQPVLGAAQNRSYQAASRPRAGAGTGAAAAAGAERGGDARGGDLGHAGLLPGAAPPDPAPAPGPAAEARASGEGRAGGAPGSLERAGAEAGTAPGSEYQATREGSGPSRASAGTGPAPASGAGLKREAGGTRATPRSGPPGTGAASKQLPPVRAERSQAALAADPAAEQAVRRPVAAGAVKSEASEGRVGATGAACVERDPPAEEGAAKDPRKCAPALQTRREGAISPCPASGLKIEDPRLPALWSYHVYASKTASRPYCIEKALHMSVYAL